MAKLAIIAAEEFEDAEWVDQNLTDLTGVDMPVATMLHMHCPSLA